MKILILGGYGTFGGRLAYLLAKDERLTLVLAGRSKTKAQKFCDSLPAGAIKIAAFFDRIADAEAQIKEINPDLVVDATGPFQVYGDDPHNVVKACIANNVNYMDLADGSEFVKGISQFDGEAKARDIYILSGVSSFPVLTAAVVRLLSHDMLRIRHIRGGIAPSAYAGVGLNVIRAITSYAGKRLPLWRNGKLDAGYGLTETMRYTISPPGYVPLHNALFSLVDVPDLRVLPDLWPELDSIWLGAGPVPEILHRMLIGLAWLVRKRILPTLLPFAPLFHHVINIIRWGEHRGGMFVSVEGTGKDGERIERSWHLLAEGSDGPFIPSMAIEAIVLKYLAGNPPVPGARPATHELEVRDYQALFRDRAIYTGTRESDADQACRPLYQRLLGEAWTSLPNSLKTMHQSQANELIVEGLANVETGRNLLARLVRVTAGFPPAGRDVPIQVVFSHRGDGERWRRTIAGRKFSSDQWEGRGRYERLLMERIGLFTFAFALVLDADKLRLILRHWTIFGIRLPLFLAPHGDTFECESNGLFHFHVEVKTILTGLIVRYQGWLATEKQT
jgi:hypothetical protein